MRFHSRNLIHCLLLLSLLALPVAPALCQLCIDGVCEMPEEGEMPAAHRFEASEAASGEDTPCHGEEAPVPDPESPAEDCCELSTAPASEVTPTTLAGPSVHEIQLHSVQVSRLTVDESRSTNLSPAAPRGAPDPAPPQLFALHRSLLL